MPFVSDTTLSYPATSLSPTTNAIVHLAREAVSCLYDGFRGDFTRAATCLRESGLHHLLTEEWQNASQRYLQHGATVPGFADVGVACALGAVAIGVTYRYLWPEFREFENAFEAGENTQRQWLYQTQVQLRRRTLADVTAMRQCLAVFEATQSAQTTPAPQPTVPMSRRTRAERHIAESLLLHIADAPQADFAGSDRVAALCQLLAHGLGFKLPKATLEALHVSEERSSLIRYDDAFTLLRERLEPDWRHDEAGSPTFSVHPVDVQVLDPAETTADLSETTRDARRLLTHPVALQRVRARVVALFAASVREDCGGVGDWRNFAQLALVKAAARGMTCDQVRIAMGIATRSGISARYAWRWTDEPVPQPGAGVLPTIPLKVAQWIARVMLVAGTPGSHEPCPPRVAALARGDTPASLVIGSDEWIHLVDGIERLGRDHWRVAFAHVCEEGKA
ncbi:hypothetical protein [Pandoraea sp. NPDC087047]|uniref:hypothetical protein n=1 Tax=Pandoraea sp. NPDC087047 TaxID=3364390 RepID=UPI0037F4B1E0